MDLHGRRLLVTGASSGIGAATARACAEAGARVACLARREDRVKDLADEIGGVGVAADVTDPGGVRAAVATAALGLDGLDGVVNNAGYMAVGGVADGRPEQWRRMLDVNVYGVLVTTQAVIPHLRRAGRGDVVNVSSLSGRRVPNAAAGVYAASKFAVHALSEGLRRELGPEGIRVTVISPGFVDTDLGGEGTDAEAVARLERRIKELGLPPTAIARQIVRALAEPPEVQLYEVAVQPTAQQ